MFFVSLLLSHCFLFLEAGSYYVTLTDLELLFCRPGWPQEICLLPPPPPVPSAGIKIMHPHPHTHTWPLSQCLYVFAARMASPAIGSLLSFVSSSFLFHVTGPEI